MFVNVNLFSEDKNHPLTPSLAGGGTRIYSSNSPSFPRRGARRAGWFLSSVQTVQRSRYPLKKVESIEELLPLVPPPAKEGVRGWFLFF